MINLTLVDPKIELVNAWREAFKDNPEVNILSDFFENVLAFDCMVSAANSFGLMDGGVDLAIIRFFGQDLEGYVQQYILENYFGEQPVGTSFIIETGNEKHPFLAHTPTMRVPMSIHGTDHVYLAMKAMLEAIWRHNQDAANRPIKEVLCPGLGTSAGKMPYKEAARQMHLAYQHFKNPPRILSWNIATRRQQAIIYGGNLGLTL